MRTELVWHLPPGAMTSGLCTQCGDGASSFRSEHGGVLTHWHKGEIGHWRFRETPGANGPGSASTTYFTTRRKSS